MASGRRGWPAGGAGVTGCCSAAIAARISASVDARISPAFVLRGLAATRYSARGQSIQAIHAAVVRRLAHQAAAERGHQRALAELHAVPSSRTCTPAAGPPFIEDSSRDDAASRQAETEAGELLLSFVEIDGRARPIVALGAARHPYARLGRAERIPSGGQLRHREAIGRIREDGFHDRRIRGHERHRRAPERLGRASSLMTTPVTTALPMSVRGSRC